MLSTALQAVQSANEFKMPNRASEGAIATVDGRDRAAPEGAAFPGAGTN